MRLVPDGDRFAAIDPNTDDVVAHGFLQIAMTREQMRAAAVVREGQQVPGRIGTAVLFVVDSINGDNQEAAGNG